MHRVLCTLVRRLPCGNRNAIDGKNYQPSAVCLCDTWIATKSSREHRAAFGNRSDETQNHENTSACTTLACTRTTVTSPKWQAQFRLSSFPLQTSCSSYFHTSIASLHPPKSSGGTAEDMDVHTTHPGSATSTCHAAPISPAVSAPVTTDMPGLSNRDMEDGFASISTSSPAPTGDGDSFEKGDCGSGPSIHSPSSVASSTDAHSPVRTDVEDAPLVESSDYDEDSVEVRKPAPSIPEISFSLTPYVSKSVTLTSLVSLGVDLSQVEKIPEAAEHLLKSDFDSDVKPYILFLHDLGIDKVELGKVISKNPLLFKEHLDDLEVRVNYLEAKRFSPDAIAKVVTGAPLVLLMSVEKLDSKLGFLQTQFKLQGMQVREVVTRLPKLIIWHRQKLKDNRFYLKEFLGFSESELTKILLTSPKVFISDKYAVGKKFDFLHNVVGISHAEMTRWPHIFRTRLHLLQQRHRFLVSVGRAQYDPRQPNYVSLQALSSGTDGEFCTSVAKTSVTQFNNFLRTL